MTEAAEVQATFKEQVAQALDENGLEYSSDSAIRGIQPDFIVKTPRGRRVLLETKMWEPSPANLNRAAHLVELYRKNLHRASYVVMPRLSKSLPERGILSLSGIGLITVMGLVHEHGMAAEAQPRQPNVSRSGRILFAAMPFTKDYDDVFVIAISTAARAKGVDAAARRVDKEDYVGDIVEKIKARIRSCLALVADLSETRPNVMYELGFAQGYGRPVVPICSTPLAELPFDVRNLNVLEYEKGQVHKLRRALPRRLRAALTGTS